MENSSAADLMRETLRHVAAALDSMDALIAVHEQKCPDDPFTFRKRVRRLCRSPKPSPERKSRQLARWMKNFSLLCRLDDQRNGLRYLQSDLRLLADARRVPPSEVPYWRNEFYENMATIFVIDQEMKKSLIPSPIRNRYDRFDIPSTSPRGYSCNEF